jgi:hypothetical protein
MQKTIGIALAFILFSILLFVLSWQFFHPKAEAPIVSQRVDVPATTTSVSNTTSTLATTVQTDAIKVPTQATSTATATTRAVATKPASTATTPKKLYGLPPENLSWDEKAKYDGYGLLNSPVWGPTEGAYVSKDEPHLRVVQQPPLPDAANIPYLESQIQHIYLSTKSDLDVAKWKTLTNTKYHFTFKYPADWIFKGGDDMIGGFYDSSEKYRIVELNVGSINLAHAPADTLEEVINMYLGSPIFGMVGKQQVVMRKIIDDERTIGYYSQWKIVFADILAWPYLQTRLDYQDKHQTPSTHPDPTLNIRMVQRVFIERNQYYNQPEVFDLLAATFRFTGE